MIMMMMMQEIRPQRRGICRLKSQTDSNKNQSVCLCVVYACLQETFCVAPLLLTLWGDLELNQPNVWAGCYKH